jgi:hypothetical protein
VAEGILFSQMIPRPEDVERFNTWYNEDHIPARMVLPHFVRATRYAPANAETPDYLAVYEVDDMGAFATQGYKDLKKDPSEETGIMLSRVSGFTRYISELIGDTGAIEFPGACLSVVAFAVPEEEEADFNAWYADEHVPLLMEANDWLRVRRYKVKDGQGGPWTHIALHELANLEVMDSPERAAARKGPVRETLAHREWFGHSGRWLYRHVHRADAADYQTANA